MPRVIIARSHEWANGKIGDILASFREQETNNDRRRWIEETERKVAAAKLNVFLIDEAAREFDKRCINLSKGEAK